MIEKIAKNLYDGKLKPTDLNADLLQQTLNDLRSGLAEGVGKSFVNYDSNAKRNLELNKHLYRFSGAKTYQQTALLNFYLKDKPSFADFKKEALKINDQYNKRYLETEFNTAKRSGEQATKWSKYQEQKELYPNLQYKTANDSRVREQHKNQQDIIKPIDDAFWLSWYPPNDFGCRCYVVQTDEKPTDGTPKENPSPGFNNNVGVSNMVFAEDEHPYFIFPKADVVKIKESFENLKQSNPDYQEVFNSKKGKLQVSTWADPKDIEANIKTAKAIVKNLGSDIKIKSHLVLNKVKNPEYIIDGKIGDRKSQEGKNVSSNIKSAKDQFCKVIVFDVHEKYPFTTNRLKNNIKGIITAHYKVTTFETIIIVNGDNVEKITVADWFK